MDEALVNVAGHQVDGDHGLADRTFGLLDRH